MDANAETRALGIEVEALEGLSVAQLRARLEGPDRVLILDDDVHAIPTGWPREILRLESDVLRWYYLSSTGHWNVVDRYRYRWFRERVGRTVGRLYTRRPVASPATCIRPILQLALEPDGRCRFASASLQEALLRHRLEQDAAAGRAEPPEPLEQRVSPGDTAGEACEPGGG